MIKSTYIHIGTHKTGTTSIQNFLFKNRSLLSDQGIYYPENYTRWNGHHQMAWALGAKHPAKDDNLSLDTIIDDLITGANKRKAGTLVISSEDFGRVFDIERIQTLRDKLPGSEKKIIVYLRRQDDYLEAEYRQHVRMFETRFTGTIENFFTRYDFSPRYNYYSFLKPWISVFGEENLLVRVFEKEQLLNNDLLTDYASLIGIDISPLEPLSESEKNISLGPAATEVLRRFNHYGFSQAQHYRLVELLQGLTLEDSGSSLSVDGRKAILDRYTKENTSVAREFGKPEQGLFKYENNRPWRGLKEEDITNQLISLVADLVFK